MTVSYLGLERTLQSSVTVRRVYEVDELAKVRRLAQEQRKAEEGSDTSECGWEPSACGRSRSS